MSFNSGERLKLAKELKSLTWQEIANAVNRTDSAVKKWVKDGIKDSSISTIANYFNVDEWVFLDESLSEEEFKKIIFDPSLQKKNQLANNKNNLPVRLFQFTSKGGRAGLKSKSFVLNPGSILMSVKIFGVGEGGIKDTQFAINKLNMNDAEEAQMLWTKSYIHDTIYINVRPEDVTTNKVVKEKIIEIFIKEEFYISARSSHDFEVSVYEMTAYPK